MVKRRRITEWRRPGRAAAVRRVREVIRSGIVSGRYAQVLPSEAALFKEHAVSRGIVREVLDLLRDEGLIDRVQGTGILVVTDDRQSVKIDRVRKWEESLHHGYSRVAYEVLDDIRTRAPRRVIERLSLRTTGESYELSYIEQLTVLDGKPWVVRGSWLPLDVREQLDRAGAQLDRSFYELLAELGHELSPIELSLEATIADRATADVLDLEVGAPVMAMERVVRRSDGRVIEYGLTRIAGDRIIFTQDMSWLASGQERWAS